MSDSLHNTDFDLDEDLFDFAQVASDADDGQEGTDEDLAEVLASFREAHAEEPVPEAPFDDMADLVAEALEPQPAPVPRPAPAPAAAVTPEGAAARRTRPVAKLPEPTPEGDELHSDVLSAAPPARFSRGLVAIALSVTLINSVLAIVFLRRPTGSHEDVRAEEAAPAVHESAPLEREPASRDELPSPDLATRVHGHPALDAAREELARGDYAACRQHAYSLLSIIDRFDDPRREEIEADCQFLIAQALHLEALARLGRSE